MIARKLVRNFIYQPLIKPFTYLRRRRRPQRDDGIPWKLPPVEVRAMRQRPPQAKCGPAPAETWPHENVAGGSTVPTATRAGSSRQTAGSE